MKVEEAIDPAALFFHKAVCECKLPEKERAQAIRDLLRTMPAKDRALIEAYLREIQKRSSK